MKRIVWILAILSSILPASAQQKSIDPLFGADLNRMVTFAQVEDTTYHNVLIEIKSGKMGATLGRGVKVTVWDSKSGKELYEKRFPKSFMYLHPDGTVQISKGDASTKALLFKSDLYKGWIIKISGNGIINKE